MYMGWDGDFETFKDFCHQDLGLELLKTTGEDGDRKMSIKMKRLNGCVWRLEI